jgi:hypothetical protein
MWRRLALVVGSRGSRLDALGLSWTDDVPATLYTVHDACSILDEILTERRISPAFGITWHRSAPPVDLLELQIDLRRCRRESLI